MESAVYIMPFGIYSQLLVFFLPMTRTDSELTCCHKQTEPLVRKKALCIGIGYGDLEEPRRLPQAREDPRKLRRLLSKRYGFKKHDVTLLIDDDHPDHIQPTRSNIMEQIHVLVHFANSGDRLVFFFSGHGSQIPNLDGSEDDGYDEVIWPCDVIIKEGGAAKDVDEVEKFIMDDDLKVHLVDRLPNGVHLTALLDCCHSGTGLDLPHSYSASNSNLDLPRTESPTKIDPADPVSFSEPDMLKSISVDSAEGPSRPPRRRPTRAGTRRQNESALNMPFYASVHLSTDASDPSRQATIESRSRKNSKVFGSFSKHVTSWSACLDDQVGFECPDGGMLTQAFIKALRKNPEVTYQELLNALTNELLKISVFAKKSLKETMGSLPCPVPSLGSLRPIDEDLLGMRFTF
ncbi:hypothetical protein SCHPADRAFT_898901 [Schizopora paradoxa]|uniref:Peptidase C14 caspase domain-containing protein n=1 Tax=Schizopora paradoxa TaxID=27342 RepID=A0A0H2S4Z5_9AGAM|nr:hypothetical protein SCHPADRAFT_898901 [Schizopora paradoxa]